MQDENESLVGEELDDVSPADLSDEDLERIISGDEALPQGDEATSGETQATEQQGSADGGQTPEAELEQLRASEEALKEQLRRKELYIQRRSTEIGELRKQLKAANERITSQLDELYAESPAQGTEAQLQVRDNLRAIEELNHEEAHLERTHKAESMIAQHVKPEEWSVEAMAASLKRDNLPDEVIERFKAAPLSVLPPEALINLVKRAKAEEMLLRTVQYTKQLYEENLRLKKRPGEVLRQVADVAKQGSFISGGGGAKRSVASEIPVHELSDAELEAVIKQTT